MIDGASAADSRLRGAVVVDVDGTLCDVRSIRHLVEPTGRDARRNFEQFHAESISCPAFPEVLKLVKQAAETGLAVLVVTGREERWSFLTSAWLADHGVHYDELLMRPTRDYRPDHVIKAEILLSVVGRYDLLLAVDDREDIAQVWKAAGIPTALVSSNGCIAPPRGTTWEIDSRIASTLELVLVGRRSLPNDAGCQ